MPMIPFCVSSYESQSPNVSCERSVNWYPEIPEVPNMRVKQALYPAPGYQVFATLPQSNVRGLFVHRDRLFAVAGTGFYEISSIGVVTIRGTVASDTNPVTMCTNGDAGSQVFICSGGTGYLFDLNSLVFSTVMPGLADVGGFIDGYFVALDKDTSTFYLSALNDGTSWDPLDKAQRTTAADPWVGMVIANRQIHLYGTLTTESWYNSGDPDFPFTPVANSLVRDGIEAPNSAVALVDNTRIWLSANAEGAGVVKRAAGYDPTRISTHAVENAIQQYGTTSDCIAWAYQEEGHTFFVMSFPSALATWVYDATTQAWHERGWWNTELMRFDSIRARCHVYAFEKHLVGDRLSGGIYEQSNRLATDMGSFVPPAGVIGDSMTAEPQPLGVRRLRQGPHIANDSKWIFYDEVRLLLENGVGNSLVSSPKIMVQFSDDGGHTWSAERWWDVGKIGEYGARVHMHRLGRSRDRVFRVVSADAVPWRILGMEVGTF